LIGTTTIVAQDTQKGIFQGIACPVPIGAASVQIQAIMNTSDITTIGIALSLEVIVSKDFGVTWNSSVAIPVWYSGPSTVSLPLGLVGQPASPPGISTQIVPGSTHYSGIVTLTTNSNVGLALTFIDANGVML